MPTASYAEAMVNYRQHSGSAVHWTRVIETLGFPDTVSQGYQLQNSYVNLRAMTEQRAGYKVALGSPSSQALLGASEPIIGVLFAKDLLPSGSRINKSQGIVLAVEADLLATVSSAAINGARTIEEVAQHIESLHAYIEVPDLPFPFASDVAPRFTASNAGAHLGVVGSEVRASASDEFIQQLASMQVVLSTVSPKGESRQLSNAPGSSLMSHPYESVLFLLSKLGIQGRSLKKGDVISLGAYSKPTPIKTLMSGHELAISIRYHGLLDHKTGNSASALVYFD
ncbi:MAG: hypothetical protein AAF542_13890 [Pseudomonadota bacterium]